MTPSPALMQFLDLVGFSEGTSTSPITKNNGYDVIVTGINGPEIFTDYSDHPFAHRPPQIVRETPLLESTAAGRYQLLYRYWKVYKVQLSLPDYSPASQDQVALQQMKERFAIDLILGGHIQSAIEACATVWASFPGNDYSQGGKTMGELLSKYQELSSQAATGIAS